jgi:hypothetical protein
MLMVSTCARVSVLPTNPTSAHDQGLYIRALKTTAVTIKCGHFLTHSVPTYLSGVTPRKKAWVDKTEERAPTSISRPTRYATLF